ncbi:MAG: hypothetical protein LBF93_08035, partial [Zoogloeaceae bacterium]|nr:hypothetical protein [Zoogloeaceae bacterium]
DKKIDVGEDSVILVSHHDVFGEAYYAIDAYKFDKEMVFTAPKNLMSGSPDPDIEDFTKFVQTVRYRPEYEIPRDPGICLVNGFIANDENMKVTEHASLQFKLKDNPDIAIRIASSANIRIRGLQPFLLERVLGQKTIQRIKGFRTVNSGKLSVNDIPGEEWLVQGLSDDKTGHTGAVRGDGGGG